MRYYTILITALLCVQSSIAQKKVKPKWLDTIPPAVEVEPVKKHQSTPFFVYLKSNEDGAVWYGINTPEPLKKYDKGINITKEGETSIYFQAEDMYGNMSVIDTVHFVLDLQRPLLTIAPKPGVYSKRITMTLNSNESCRFYYHSDPGGRDTTPVNDTIFVNKQFSGYISAVDSAGNRTRSSALYYTVDTSSVSVAIQPAPGLFNYSLKISFKASRGAKVYYSFDPNTIPGRFTPYFEPVQCPYGLNLVRYYAKSKTGQKSALRKARYVIDTIPPKIRYEVKEGVTYDVLTLFAKGRAEIRYAFNNITSFEESYLYKKPIRLPHKGKAYIKAVARDEAGNLSRRLIWERKYDKKPPTLHSSHVSGTYTRQFNLLITANEPAKIFYTLDESDPGPTSLVYRGGISISKKGKTVVRYVGVDNAGNLSRERSLEFQLDFSAPSVRVKIEESLVKNEYYVFLKPSERGTIHYETGDRTPTRSSPIYKEKVAMRAGEILRYFAVDNAGNRSEVFVMDDLQKPITSIAPKGGVFSRIVRIVFTKNIDSHIFFRMLPDTQFTRYKDTVVLNNEGTYIVEYFSKSSDGFKSPIRREQYFLVRTPPHINLSVKKGAKDSISVFFDCNENASIYYTLDGSSPSFSNSTRTAGNKFTKSKDRISIHRGRRTKLAFFAEDAAGNQGAISVIDIFKPRVVPSIPPSRTNKYDRILTISLNTFDDRSQIFYERSNKLPTTKSPVFKEPVTLLHSDTIRAFVVDASGYHGEMDTFVYLIDLPPSPHFTVNPEITEIGKSVTFDASGTLDHESAMSSLTFLWDFDGDGVVDVTSKGQPVTNHLYKKPGKYHAALKVIDPLKHETEISNEVLVRGICPGNMVFVPREAGKSFCIDRYEWPNKKGAIPHVAVSWIRAKMHCYDEGKRLCSADEWQYACSGRKQKAIKGGGTLGRYPYGSQYEKERCPTEGDEIFKSGGFNKCDETFGTFDMLGNVWEWVSDKRNGAPVIMGGSFKYGNKTHCGFSSESSLVQGAPFTGFRCCK